MLSSLNRWIKNGAPDKGYLEEVSFGRLYRRLYLIMDVKEEERTSFCTSITQ